MNHDEQQERIDDYLRGRMTAPRDFERDLQVHPELQSEMEATRRALDAIDISEHQRLKDRLQHLEASRDSGQSGAAAGARVIPIGRRSRRRRLFYVATVALLVFMAGYFLLAPGDNSSALLAVREVEPYDNIAYPITKSGADAGDPRAAAYLAYETGDYARAAEEFRRLPAPAPEDRFYLAQSLLAQEEYAESAALFNSLAASTDFKLADESSFYQAIARLGEGDLVDGKAQLSRIADTPGHPSREAAVRLLQKL